MEVPLKKMKCFSSLLSLKVALLTVLIASVNVSEAHTRGGHGGAGDGVQPLSKIAIHRAVSELHENASIKAKPVVLGTKVLSCHILYMNSD